MAEFVFRAEGNAKRATLVGDKIQPAPGDRPLALFASWVHGSVARPQWVGDKIQQVHGDRWDESSGPIANSDVNGLPTGSGVTYQLGASQITGIGGSLTVAPFDPANPFQGSLKGYWFHFPIPTPVIVANRRAALRRAFVLWTASDGVSPVAVHLWDGSSRFAVFGVTPHPGGTTDMIPNVTRFDLQAPHSVIFGIGVSVGVSAQRDGTVTFVSAGIDVEA